MQIFVIDENGIHEVKPKQEALVEAFPRFDVGRVVVTCGAVATMEETYGNAARSQMTRLIDRHVCGDWGDLGDDDKALNEEALREGERILSRYNVQTPDEGEVGFYVITEWDRSYTTLLRCDEY